MGKLEHKILSLFTMGNEMRVMMVISVISKQNQVQRYAQHRERGPGRDSI